jgi:hypothetical protein
MKSPAGFASGIKQTGRDFSLKKEEMKNDQNSPNAFTRDIQSAKNAPGRCPDFVNFGFWILDFGLF